MSLSRFYSISQIEYCRNFIFKRHFPIHKIFERSCEIGLWRLTANRISEIFGVRLDKRLRGKLIWSDLVKLLGTRSDFLLCSSPSHDPARAARRSNHMA